MAGIYLHIPYCRQACHYCNFHFSTSLKSKNDFVAALLKEMEGRSQYIGGEPVETIYFGGGTPSLLDEGELDKIMNGLHKFFNIETGAEITLEANPDDIDMDIDPASDRRADPGPGSGLRSGSAMGSGKLRAWKRAGINRLSIGVQSFFGEDLLWMNRAHNAGQAIRSIRTAQDEGIANMSIDLIYGGPTLPDAHWRQNVEQAIALGIPHLSCYALTVEPKTALDKMIHQHKKEAVSPEDQARQFLLLMDWMSAAGYEHYEISNFALPGLRSRHNSSYWQGKPYLGLGPSAHSFNGRSRQWNVSNNALYIDALTGAGVAGGAAAGGGIGETPGAPFEKEDLTDVQQLNEYIMISLRTMEGCDLRRVAERFGGQAARELKAKAGRYIRSGSVCVRHDGGPVGDDDGLTGERLVLLKEGRLLADGIAADLFFEA